MPPPAAFQAFGDAHLAALLLTLSAAIAIPAIVARLASVKWQREIGRVLGAALIGHELCRIWLRVVVFDAPLAAHLPLHLCGAALILTAIMLWRRSFRLYEVAYFWGLGGSIPALLTPDLQLGYPHPVFVTFFTGHGLVLLGVIYATMVYGFRPSLRSAAIAIVATIAYGLVMIPVNILLDANYLYLCHKPSQPSLLDYMGPWPWYVAGLLLMTVAACLLFALPFTLRERLSARRSDQG